MDVCLYVSFDNCLVVKGRFIKSNLYFSLINVYAPCESEGEASVMEKVGSI